MRWVLTAGWSRERFRWDATIPTDAPTDLLTTRLPLTARLYPAQGWAVEATATGVWQRVARLPLASEPVGSTRFGVVDLRVTHRLPQRRITLSVEAKNLFATDFSYQDDSFRSPDPRLSPFLPIRRLFVNVSIAL